VTNSRKRSLDSRRVREKSNTIMLARTSAWPKRSRADRRNAGFGIEAVNHCASRKT
jgi:hypothetical protein